jgi:hypothetical protein
MKTDPILEAIASHLGAFVAYYQAPQGLIENKQVFDRLHDAAWRERERLFKARANTEHGLHELIKHFQFCCSVHAEFPLAVGGPSPMTVLAESVALIERKQR